jgi:hypothetical protein
MSEPVQQPSGWRKALGCLIGLVGGWLAFLSLLIGVCFGVSGELQKDASLLAFVVVGGAVGIALLILAYRLRRRQ